MSSNRTRRNDLEPGDHSLAGWLLIAHPSLQDASFKHSVVLISAHDKETGAIGIVLNHPMDKTLSDIKTEYVDHPIGKVPLYYGGPVAPKELILTAWKKTENPCVFKLHFGLDIEQAAELFNEDPSIDIRGFVGYSGWSSGQLEDELKSNAWASMVLDAEVLDQAVSEKTWKSVLKRIRPEWSFLIDAPVDPEMN